MMTEIFQGFKLSISVPQRLKIIQKIKNMILLPNVYTKTANLNTRYRFQMISKTKILALIPSKMYTER